MKTPDLPPGLNEGFYGDVNEKGEITLYLISRSTVIWKKVQDTANIEQIIFMLLALTGASQQRMQEPIRSTLGEDAQIRTVGITKAALAPNQLPGHETLLFQVGQVRLGFHIPHQLLGQLGKAFLAASASVEQS